jgi:hypothetical protein
VTKLATDRMNVSKSKRQNDWGINPLMNYRKKVNECRGN